MSMPGRILKKLFEIVEKQEDKTLFFFDEGRFGLKPVIGRYWTKKGTRPVVKVQPRYGNFYVYSAVCPMTGENVSLFLPWVNTAKQ
jgi:hypothetical protein